MASSTGGNLPKNQKQMKKLDFKQRKYILPLLALPFLLLFVYVGAQFTKEDTSEKDKPKELLDPTDYIKSIVINSKK